MRVTIHYLTQIKRAAGCGSESVDAADAISLRDFLCALAKRHDATFSGLLLDDAGEPRKSLLFFVADEHAELSRPVSDGDTITILAPMSGG